MKHSKARDVSHAGQPLGDDRRHSAKEAGPAPSPISVQEHHWNEKPVEADFRIDMCGSDPVFAEGMRSDPVGHKA
ncbi:MAG: hypothetical protein ACHQ50_10265 [Fimbriimonadales bacterium]